MLHSLDILDNYIYISQDIEEQQLRNQVAKREKEREMQERKQLESALSMEEPDLSQEDLSMISHAKAMQTAESPAAQMAHHIQLATSLKGNINK